MTNGKTQKMATKTASTRHRSFGKRKTTAREPITFDLLDGKYEFEAKAQLQGAVILDFVADSSGESADGAAHLVEFILKSLKDDKERERFNEVIRSEDPDDVIDIDDLGEIVAFLVEEYTARPTEESGQ